MKLLEEYSLDTCPLKASHERTESAVPGTLARLFKSGAMILVFMMIITLSGCSVVSMVPASPLEDTSLGPRKDFKQGVDGRYKYLQQSNTENHQAGTVESVIEYGEDSVIGVHYPVFGKEEIDTATRQFVEDTISGFMSEVDDFEAEHSDLKAELNVDYETWLVEDGLVSIKFIILMNMPYYAHPDVRIETAVYDLERQQPVLLRDILIEGSLPKLAQLARDDLAANPDYSDYFDLDLFTSGTEPVDENYSHFLLTQEHLVLLFQKYQIFAGAAGEPRVEIPYGSLEGIIDFTKPDLVGLMDSPGSSEPPLQPDPSLQPGASSEQDPSAQPVSPTGPDYPRDPGTGPDNKGKSGNTEEPGAGDLPVVREIDPDKPMVALTFDDGPFARSTGSILDTLKAHDAVATFFVLGNRVPDNADILKRMVNEGHQIGNHSLSHKQLTTLAVAELQYQIEKTQSAVKSVTGIEPVVMRPTYGSYNDELRQSIDMPVILWSLDTRDWETREAAYVSKQVLENVRDGDIILMHDIYMSTADAVEIVVPELKSRGYQLVTISELYRARGVSLEAGKVYRREAGM